MNFARFYYILNLEKFYGILVILKKGLAKHEKSTGFVNAVSQRNLEKSFVKTKKRAFVKSNKLF